MRQHGLPAPVIDTGRPHSARIYDYLLGGKDNYRVDERAGDALVAAASQERAGARANRAFLERAVRHVVAAGVRQIIDIGAGLPHHPNVHEVARATAPGVGVAYVDNDPIVIAHADALLSGSGRVGVALADLRDPHGIVEHPRVRDVIDFGRPVALLLVSVLHFLSRAERPEQAVAALRDALVAGSCLVLSHATDDFADCSAAQAVYATATTPLTPRSRHEIAEFLDGFELLEPGLVPVSSWRPDAPYAARTPAGGYGAVARKAG
ncbi:SAM-dependent methyltransferase [Streptomyces sp. NBC_00525]|uniref:SAM-dependent methyltransferase n=1 Tax=Streptomyces sp. NBC_00525 TaxID=2903660 RepID=UPI002E8248AD|nr:SAM-dependent methyltransferase [Streptomyces sp. NBC_00525]WUC96865.1 SAM-dependent methyltransferase [Streptomyces sp. NBC_00525]